MRWSGGWERDKKEEGRNEAITEVSNKINKSK